jgi:ABC-2 type transport system ATP-binding protein
MIEVEQLRKVYPGADGSDAARERQPGTAALDGFSLRVERGALFGLVGPNGAGKTTLLKVLATLLQPDGGSARIDGLELSASSLAIKAMVGYLPDQAGVYQDMSVREFLEFFAEAFRLHGPRRRRAVERALARSGLAERAESYVEELSFGMKQRLLLAKTLLHEPRVLLLDEPATGLDPSARLALRDELRRLNAEGVTILVSSHILSDLEDICTDIALIAQGRNAADAEGNTVIRLRRPELPTRAYEIEILGEAAVAAVLAAAVPGVRVLETGPARLAVEIAGADAEAAALLRHLVTAGFAVVRFAPRTVALEERYRRAFAPKPPGAQP